MYEETDGKIEYIRELRKLNRMVIDKYVELLNCLLVVQGDEVEAKVKEISNIFFNMTHLLNLIRQHQARQTLIAVMDRQIKERNKKAEYLESYLHIAHHHYCHQTLGVSLPPTNMCPRNTWHSTVSPLTGKFKRRNNFWPSMACILTATKVPPWVAFESPAHTFQAFPCRVSKPQFTCNCDVTLRRILP